MGGEAGFATAQRFLVKLRRPEIVIYLAGGAKAERIEPECRVAFADFRHGSPFNVRRCDERKATTTEAFSGQKQKIRIISNN